MSCRICYGGPDEPEQGRLISPCKCAGTTKYVHIVCLQEWRSKSTNIDRFFRCDICHHEYSLRRVRLASYLLSRTARVVTTLVLLNIIAFLLGYMSYGILETTLTEEDIELILRTPNIILRQFGIRIRRRIVRRGSWLEHHVLGTAAMGALGFFKLSFSFFYTSAFRRRRTVSLILVIAGLVYSFYELYRYTGIAGSWILRLMANWIVNDVPQDLGSTTPTVKVEEINEDNYKDK